MKKIQAGINNQWKGGMMFFDLIHIGLYHEDNSLTFSILGFEFWICIDD